MTDLRISPAEALAQFAIFSQVICHHTNQTESLHIFPGLSRSRHGDLDEIAVLQLNPVPRLFDGAIYEEPTENFPILTCLQGLDKVICCLLRRKKT